MDSIMDATRGAMSIDPTALFVNASSMGASEVDDTPQGAYNTAKRCMEIYLKYSGVGHINYRLPAVYGEGMHDDHFIKKCVDGKAHIPEHTHMPYYISHVDDVVDALVKLEPLKIERITLGEIYEQFTTGRRGLHRPTSNT
jgi:nucleoside-diphosphate-sugar epimerase